METKTYNGWTNYETWDIKLWIDNEQSSVEYWNDRAINLLSIALADNIFTKEERATLDLMDELKQEFEDGLPEVHGPYADLLNAAMSEVNWHEIAKHIIEEVGK